MGLTNGKCDVCGKKLTSYIQDESGRCYCSEKCYETFLPKCSVCNKPMKQWTETEDGKKYCSKECYESTFDVCKICNKPLKEWIESNGDKFCSEECFLKSCPTCSVCGKHTESWIESDKGEIFCSEECRELTLPTCSVCGKHMNKWLVSEDNKMYCSEECYAHVLPKCMHCGKSMKEWLVTEDGRIYCSNICISESNKIMNKVNILGNMTGLTIVDIETTLVKNSWSLDEAILNIDNYIQSLEGKVVVSKTVVDGIKNAGIYNKLANNLSNYNTMRGGVGGFKGFVFEEMHAANESLGGQMTEVIANNGPADFLIRNMDGTYSYGQAKVGYNSSKIDWSAYRGQDIVIDKGNSKLIKSAKDAGMNVIESDVSKADAQRLAKAMQCESKITGKTNAAITANLHSYHQAGINSAKAGAAFGAGCSIGSNLVDLVSGDKTIGEASVAIAKDTATAAVGSYVVGVGTTAIANTAIGGTVISGATAAGTALAGTTIGTAAITTGATVTAMASGAAATVGGAIATTTVGAAVTGGITAAITALGATAVGTAIVAAAPLVAAGAAIGGAVKIGKKLFGKGK